MTGYEKLASLVMKHAEVATSQRFEFLNTLNVLFLQAKPERLEHDLRDSTQADLESGDTLIPSIRMISELQISLTRVRRRSQQLVIEM